MTIVSGCPKGAINAGPVLLWLYIASQERGEIIAGFVNAGKHTTIHDAGQLSSETITQTNFLNVDCILYYYRQNKICGRMFCAAYQ